MFEAIHSTRPGSPRAKYEVRAKLVHTATQGRRIEVFIPAPVMSALGWKEGGRVSSEIGTGQDAGILRIAPSHVGQKLGRAKRGKPTMRLCLYGTFIQQTACAPVRKCTFNTSNGILHLEVPQEWLSSQFRATEMGVAAPSETKAAA